jgi:altronate dehydratase large subunit
MKRANVPLTGFMRDNGSVGIRNHVAVLAAADNVNPLARQLAERVPGVTFLRASFGRGQMGDDFDLAVRTMAGLAAHPNVSGCLIVSFEPESAERIAQRAKARGSKILTLSLIDEGGVTNSLRKGEAMLAKMAEEAVCEKRVPIEAKQLTVGLECGGSDVTSGLVGNPTLGTFTDRMIDLGASAIFSEPVECLGAETLLKARAVTPKVAKALIGAVQRRSDVAKAQGCNLLGTNPTPDNIAGGLTTIEEKSLGALAKSGSRPIEGLIDYGEAPPRPGLWFMDAPSAATENITALAAGGAQIILFVTGSANPIGNPISPTVKICANPRTMRRMAEHIDVDLSMGLSGGFGPDEGVRRIEERFTQAVNGTLVAAERLGFVDISISRIAQST